MFVGIEDDSDEGLYFSYAGRECAFDVSYNTIKNFGTSGIYLDNGGGDFSIVKQRHFR